MKKLRHYFKNFRLFFSMLCLLLRNVRLFCLLIFTKRLMKCYNKACDICLYLNKKNEEHPFTIEFFALYSKLTKKSGVVSSESETAGASSMITELARLMMSKQLYMNQNLSINDVSRELATNRTYVSKEIKRAHKSGFRSYLNRIRLEKAKELMHNSDSNEITLIAISEKVGFRNYGTFNTAFKKEYGITPGEWKLREMQPVN